MAGKAAVVCGNLSSPHPGFKDYALYRIGERKILVTSLLSPTIANSPVARLTIIPPDQALPRILSTPHDLAIVIFHLPDARAREMVSRTPGIDIAILAKQIGVYSRPAKLNGCCLLKCNNRGRSLGWLNWDLKDNTPKQFGIIKLKPQVYKPDPEVQLLVSNYEKWRDQRYFARRKKQQRKKPPAESYFKK